MKVFMKTLLKYGTIFFALLFLPGNIHSQNSLDVHKLTDDDWLQMSTEERLQALNASNNHARDKTFVGDFGMNYDIYRRWGYDYYEMEDRYENYAFRGFENYNVIEDRRQKWYYNQFGDRLTKMTRGGSIWYERINDDGTTSISNPSGYINSRLPVDGIWVARESTDDWAVSAVGAGALRTKLTPLTVSIPNMTGMKVDFQSANYRASFINSNVFSRLNHSLVLRGAQLKRKFGALTLGATYANMYSVMETRDNGNDLRGTVNSITPTPIIFAVRIVDDSPHDGDGPIVHEVKLLVDGKYRPDILPTVIKDDLRRELVTAVNSKSQQEYLEIKSTARGSSFDELSLFERSPKYLDYLYMHDYTRGWNSKTLTDNFDVEKGKTYYTLVNPGLKPLQVSGNEYVVYLFDLGSITDTVKRVAVDITVANDYRIQTSQIYTTKSAGGHDNIGENFQHYNAQYWKTMAQADGNVKDGSNLRTVRVDFGYEVGNTIYGFDLAFNHLGFKVNGEFVTNYHYYMFAEGVPGTGFPSVELQDITPLRGHRSSQMDHAYYLTVQKDWKRFGFAGEVFKMGKFYRPSINLYVPIDRIPWNYELNSRNSALRFSMIEDNDDDDQYADTSFDAYKSMSYGMQTTMDPDGVFPGNDLDNDSYPDNEKNSNGIPDYNEPFLMFDVDPDEYIFGDDFNNNTIPDFREDDMKYDTPYDLDRKGHHVYLRFTPQKNIDVMLGSFRTRGIGLDTRTDDDYLKLNFTYDVYNIGNIFAEYRYEKIQDNIQDSFVVVPNIIVGRSTLIAGGARYTRDFYYDEIEYRNSKVNKIFLTFKLRPIPSVTLENHVKYERNHQIEGIMYDNTFQASDVLSTFAMVNKFVYTRTWRNWTFSPGVKFRFYKKGRSASLNPLDHYLMRIPVVYLKYRISNSTTVTYGLQGFRGFELQYKDYIQDHNDLRKVNYILQIENRTRYFGFDVWGGFGYKMEHVMFDKDYRKFEEYKTSTFFVQMWLGY